MRKDRPSLREFQLMSLLFHPLRGREIAKELERRFGEKVAPGSIYTTLSRLEEQGWIKSQEKRVGSGAGEGRVVRFFRMNASGAAAWNSAREMYRDLGELSGPEGVDAVTT